MIVVKVNTKKEGLYYGNSYIRGFIDDFVDITITNDLLENDYYVI